MGIGNDTAGRPENLGPRLFEAREARLLSQQDVADVLGVSRVLVSHWERGERRPSEQVLERLARLYGIDLATLLAPQAALPPEDLAELLYRDAEGGIDVRARAGLQDFVRFLDGYAELIESFGEPFDFALRHSPFSVRKGFMSKQDVRRKAEEVRDWLRLGLGPVGDLPGLLDEMGVTLYRVPLGADLEWSVSGAFLNHARLGFCVAVNLETTPGRQAFTMAHELAHALFHSHTETLMVSYWTRADDHERFADMWAGEFLVPTEGLRRAAERFGVRAVTNPTEVIQLQRHFGVSYGMMLLRLLQARLLDKGGYDELKTARPVVLAAQLGYPVEDDEWEQDPERSRLERFPRRFVRMITSAVRAGEISLSSAAELTDLSLDEITELLSFPGDGDPDLTDELREMDNVRKRAVG